MFSHRHNWVKNVMILLALKRKSFGLHYISRYLCKHGKLSAFITEFTGVSLCIFVACEVYIECAIMLPADRRQSVVFKKNYCGDISKAEKTERNINLLTFGWSDDGYAHWSLSRTPFNYLFISRL